MYDSEVYGLFFDVGFFYLVCFIDVVFSYRY